MEFRRMKGATDHVSRLPDRPSLAEGYTPERLKEIFDRGATEVKEYLNEVLLAELEANAAGSSAAEKLGSAFIEGLNGVTVHGQLMSLKAFGDRLEEALRGLVLGQLPEGSVTEEKLSEALRALLQQRRQNEWQHISFTSPGTFSFTAPREGQYRFRLVGAGGGGTLYNPGASALGSFDGYGGPSGAYAELVALLSRGQRVSLEIGSGGAPVEGFSVGQYLSTAEYDGDYLANRRYSSPGGDTVLYLGSEDRVVCKGGDCLSSPSPVRFYGQVDSRCVTRSGAAFGGAGGRPLSSGADSALGQGASEWAAPGAGAGGRGGSLYFGEDASYDVLSLPGKGGDGAVFIDYIGGVE